jgi:hypothetical protein
MTFGQKQPKRKIEEGSRCTCREPFINASGEADTCNCTVLTIHESGICPLCRGYSPFGERPPAHTSTGYKARLRKLPTYGGKSTD